jgi:hypothetical protein
MKAFRLAAFAVASVALFGPAWAEVRSIQPTLTLPRPPSPVFYNFGQAVAIDNGYIIVLGLYDGGQSALLYRRNSTDGKWIYQRALLTVNPPIPVRGDVRMKNGIAVIQFGSDETIFEFSGGTYVRATSAAPIQHPGGIAISQNSILIGGNDCDYDAVIYQKGANGSWGITGRIDDHQGPCRPDGIAVDLNYDYALLSVPLTPQVTAWRRNGTAMDWVPAGSLPDASVAYSPYVLQKSTAVAPGSVVFRRNGNTWTRTGMVVPVNYGNGAGEAFDVVYRDGVLVTSESSGIFAHPFLYLESSPGQFEHVAILEVSNLTRHMDISGKNVVAAVQDFGSTRFDVEVFDLPAQLRAPKTIVNDFDDLDVSDITFSGGQFALGTSGSSSSVLRQSVPSGMATAVWNDSDWTDFQLVEADVRPGYRPADSWAGVIARYVDADNFYFLKLRSNNTFGIYRRINGVSTVLRNGTYSGLPTRLSLSVDGNGTINGWVNNNFFVTAKDKTLTHGRAGLITFEAIADFDDVHVAASTPVLLLENDYSSSGAIYGRPFTEIGGNWHVLLDELENYAGLSQSDKSGDAVAFIGTPVENQEVVVRARLDSFGPPPQHAWFGLLARYVDANNHYYVTIRSTREIQIRKVVNGVVTVLGSADLPLVPGEAHEFRFRVIDDQLQLFVDDVMVASAHDHDIARGRYGIATYRTAATFDSVVVFQP